MMDNKNYGWPTSRVFPRTMEEAFPNDAERAEWFYPPERKRGYWNAIMFIAGAMMWIALAYYFVKN
jgi:hypothetical protein